MRHWLALAAIGCLSLSAWGQDAAPAGGGMLPLFGGSGRLVAAPGLDGDDRPVLEDGSASANVFADLSDATGQFRVSVDFSVDPVAGVGLELRECYGRFQLADWLKLSLGRLAYQPGNALFFSNVDYLSALDPLALLTKGAAALESPQDMLLVQFMGESWHAAAAFAPFRRPDRLVPTASAWFPRLGLLAETRILGRTYRLRNLDWADRAAGFPDLAFDPAVMGEAGFTAGPFDLAAYGYYGADRVYAVTGKITMPLTPWGVYDIALTPRHGTVGSVGASAGLLLDPFTFWADGNWMAGRLVAVNELFNPGTGWETVARPADSVGMSAGLSWRLPFANAYIAAEWHYVWYPQAPAGMRAPFLDRVVGALFNCELFDQALAPAVAGFVSLRDASWCLVPSLDIRLWGEATLSLSCPLFFGGDETELGQFARARQALAGLQIRF
jgi:hypothetical protein